MKHLESIMFAAVIGGVSFYLLNQGSEKIVAQDSEAIKYGAGIGAITQLVLRLTGIS